MKKSSLVALVVTACGGGVAAPPKALPQVEPPPSPQVASAASAPPKFRLGAEVVPRAYRLELTIDPAADSFEGMVEIDVEIPSPVSAVWMHGRQLTVSSAMLTAGDGTPRPATMLPGGERYLGLGFEAPVGPGSARLTLRYTGKLQPVETLGVFKQKYGNDWYVFTQLETSDASRVFPGFDDPRWKTPFDLTLVVPRGLEAYAGTPILSETDRGELRSVHFATTKPLPTYLVVFAVGPFSPVDAGKTRDGAPVRIIALRGEQATTRFAVATTARITAILEDYLGVAYPFAKLDSIAVPKTIGFGAMENPGLITYRKDIVLIPTDGETYRARSRYAAISGHEIAHMWFGDLVTLSWWNDTWLNESFASWAGSRAVEAFEPSWGEEMARVNARSAALGSDSLPSARPVRRPVESESDLEDVFDYTAYQKGQSILFMLEGWVGKEVFRKGVTTYLQRHAYGSATAADFFAAVSAAAEKDVTPVLSSFIDQPGAPLLGVELACPAHGAPRLLINQGRHVSAGARPADQRWSVPACVRFGAGKQAGRACTVVSAVQAELELPTRTCPQWVVPNADGAGYYYSVLRGESGRRMTRLLPAQLSPTEQAATIGDLEGLLRGAILPSGEVLTQLAALAPARRAQLVDAAARTLRPLVRGLLPDPLRPAYARYVAGLFGARARVLGLENRPSDDDASLALRLAIVPLAAIDGGDRRLTAEARPLAGRWLDDRKSVEAGTAEMALQIALAAATRSDRALFDHTLVELKKTGLEDRRTIFKALASLRDPQLMTEAFALFLAPEIDARESTGMFVDLYRDGSRDSRARRAAAEYVAAHYHEIAARIPRSTQADLFLAASFLCDQDDLARFDATLRPEAEKVVGGVSNLEDGLGAARSCAKLVQAQRPSLVGFLKGR